MTRLYTDYPITELGDVPGQEAPVRSCRVVETYHPHSKYVLIDVEGVRKEIKKGYLYTMPGRLGEVPAATSDDYACDPAEACETHGRCWIHSHWGNE